LSVPMFSEGTIVGAMLVHTNNYHQFTQAQIELFNLIASQTAIALQSAKRYKALKHTKGLVGSLNAVAWMGMASNVWGHGVRGHASTIKDRVKLLDRALNKTTPDSIAPELLEYTKRQLTQIELVADRIVKKIVTPPLSEANVNSVCVDLLMRSRIKQLWGKEPYKSYPFPIISTVGAGISVRINEFWFNQALGQLIDNSLKAMAGAKLKQLSLDIQRVDNFVEIAVTDTGGGIPDDVKPVLFKEQIKTNVDKGSGMSLLMVQCIIEAYRGEVRVGRTDSTGTTMIIRLPFEPDDQDAACISDRLNFLLISDSKNQYCRSILEAILPPSSRLEIIGEQAAIQRMTEQEYRAVIIDAGVVDNFAVLTKQLRDRDSNARIIIAKASEQWEFAREAYRAGATDYLPILINQQESLRLTLDRALAKPLLPWPR
jgi:CheY-like chemotaxis protein